MQRARDNTIKYAILHICTLIPLCVCAQIIQGLVYLNNIGVSSCCNICPYNILIDPFGRAKLYNYGLYYITEMGAAVSFPIG